MEAGGSASATTLSGGVQDVVAGGFATGTIVRGTGYAYVAAGGTASGTILSGGEFEVASGGSTGAGVVTFSGGGTLQLDDSIHFGGLVANFLSATEHLDLADIPFVSGATSATFSGGTASGTLTVTDGAHIAHIALLGNYTASQFNVTFAFDGHGGTLVTDPPVTALTDPGPFTLTLAHPT